MGIGASRLMKVLANKTVLITGASQGFGLALAEYFWQAGAHLILVARKEEVLIALAQRLQSEPTVNAQQIQIIACDIVNFPFEKIEGQRVDVLVNNAAIQGPIGPFVDNDWSTWEQTIAVDLLSPIHLTQKVLPQMRARKKGKIINLSGGGATGCRPNFSAYAVAKIGMVKFSETLAKELEDDHIDVNCVAPGAMPTQMLQEIVQAGANRSGCKEFESAAKIRQDAENMQTSMQSALQLCLYLASEQSNGVSGKLISAVWDPWQNLHENINELKNSDLYTLRRVSQATGQRKNY